MENNYQLTKIHNYVMGLMSKKEMYEMEREALNDPFLQDAIEGYKLQKGVDSQQLSILQQRLAKKIEAKSQDKKQRFYSWQRLTIAMAAGVLFLVACSLILFKYISHQPINKNTEVILMEEDLRLKTTILENSNAIPVDGWEKFNEELNSELRDISDIGGLQIIFDVDHGIPENIQIKGSNNQELNQIVSNFIHQKTRWSGDKGGINVEQQ